MKGEWAGTREVLNHPKKKVLKNTRVLLELLKLNQMLIPLPNVINLTSTGVILNVKKIKIENNERTKDHEGNSHKTLHNESNEIC